MKKWFCLPLQEKLKYLTFSVGAVVFLSIAANMLVAFFGLGGFGNILKSNSRSLAFWTAMDEESAAFDRFIQEQTKETRQEWEKSAKHTELINIKRSEKNGMQELGPCITFMKIMTDFAGN